MNSLSGKKGGDGAGMDKGRSLSEVVAGTPVAKKGRGDGGDENPRGVDDDYVADRDPRRRPRAPPAKPPPVVDPVEAARDAAGYKARRRGRSRRGGRSPMRRRSPSLVRRRRRSPCGDPLGEPDTSKVDPNRPETHFRDLTERFNALKRNKD